jgi:hypothetical protein
MTYCTLHFFTTKTNKMKSIFFRTGAGLCFILLLADHSYGQNNASVALDKMNVLYIGVDNPITITANNSGYRQIRPAITGGGGNLVPAGRPGKYIARVASVTDDCQVSVFVNNRLAGASQFRVRTIPMAQAYIGGFPSGSRVMAGGFRSQAGIGAGIKDFAFELSYQVVSFTFTVDSDEGDIVSENVIGNAFTGRVRQAIDRHVRPGKLVTIENIRVRGPDGRTTPAPSLIYYII